MNRSNFKSLFEKCANLEEARNAFALMTMAPNGSFDENEAAYALSALQSVFGPEVEFTYRRAGEHLHLFRYEFPDEGGPSRIAEWTGSRGCSCYSEATTQHSPPSVSSSPAESPDSES